MNYRETFTETGFYRKAFFFNKTPFELNLIPTYTVTGQYISLLGTRRHFFKRLGQKGNRRLYTVL